MKKIFTLLFIILLCSSGLYGKEVNFFKGKDFVALELLQKPSDYKIVYYDYGFNIMETGVNVKNMEILKFKNDLVVRIIPLSEKKALVKVQYSIKNLKDHVKVLSSNNSFKIEIYQKPILNKINNSNDSIVDMATKDLAIVPTAPVNNKVTDNVNNNLKTQKSISNKTENSSNFNFIESKDKSFSSNVIRTYLVLFFLCIFIVIGGIFFKKFYSRISPQLSNDIVKIMYKKDILPKKTIAIAKILNDYYVLGVTQNSFCLIDKISADSLKEEIKLIEGNNEKEKFINYLKDQEKENPDKEKMIKLIQLKLKEYRKNTKKVS